MVYKIYQPNQEEMLQQLEVKHIGVTKNVKY